MFFLNFVSLIFALAGQSTDKHVKHVSQLESFANLDCLSPLRQSKVVKLFFEWSLNLNFQCNQQMHYVQLVKLSKIIVIIFSPVV